MVICWVLSWVVKSEDELGHDMFSCIKGAVECKESLWMVRRWIQVMALYRVLVLMMMRLSFWKYTIEQCRSPFQCYKHWDTGSINAEWVSERPVDAKFETFKIFIEFWVIQCPWHGHSFYHPRVSLGKPRTSQLGFLASTRYTASHDLFKTSFRGYSRACPTRMLT